MTTTISIRLRPSKLEKIDSRAAALGFKDRSKYLLAVVESDLAADTGAKHAFQSEGLIGSVKIGKGSATNKNTRLVMAAALKGKREKNS